MLPLRLPKDQMEVKWASELNPILSNPMNSVLLLKDIKLVAGANVINHRLQQMPQGWFIVDINAASTIYRSAPYTDLTITLTASAPATITLGVY